MPNYPRYNCDEFRSGLMEMNMCPTTRDLELKPRNPERSMYCVILLALQHFSKD